MQYNDVAENIENFSLFELWRIYCTISNALENNHKINVIRKMLQPDMNVAYFSKSDNTMIEAIVVRVNKTRALVRNIDSLTYTNVPFYMFNVDNIPIHQNINPQAKIVLSKNNLKIGDKVGWHSNRSAQDFFGTVIKLNPKTAVIKLPDNQVWHVTYSLLFPIFDSEVIECSDYVSLIYAN
jgi:hypothetical protein